MHFSLILLTVIIALSNAEVETLVKPAQSNAIICLSTAFCPVKCKRYIMRNGCPSCECNPCVFGEPLQNLTCGKGEHTCGSNGGICKVNAALDKIYCCPKEREGCCPYTEETVNNDPDILFPCLPQCDSDADCKPGQKCCGKCPPQCVDPIIP